MKISSKVGVRAAIKKIKKSIIREKSPSGQAYILSAASAQERFGHVERAGAGDQTLILVPCLGCDWRSYDEFMERNKENYRMYAVTWPGMATTALPDVDDRSDTPYWDYIIAAMANLIRDEGLDNPILVGHSAAGPYVVRFLHDHPELVGGAISVDAIITNNTTLGYSRAERLAWAEADMADTLSQLDDEEAWRNFNTRAGGSLGDRSQFYIDMWLAPPREHVFAYWLDWLKTDVGVMLPNIQKPLLSVYALPDATDEIEAFKREKDRRFAANNASSFIQLAYVEDTGHTLWEYQPDAFDRIVVEFVAGL